MDRAGLKITVTEALDPLWTSAGEQGILAVQLCLSEEIPFDPDHQLNRAAYMDFREMVRGLCQSAGN